MTSTTSSVIPGKENVVADALSRSLPRPDYVGTEGLMNELPVGYHEVKMPGGGDSLFQCFSVWLNQSKDQHISIREAVVQEMINNRTKYNLPTGKGNNITKQLNLMKFPGQLPITQAIEAFGTLYKVKILIYYGKTKPLQFGYESSDSICPLLCLGGVHYNLLLPSNLQKAESSVGITPLTMIEGFVEHSLLDESLEERKDLENDSHEQNQIEEMGIGEEVIPVY